MKKKNKNKNLGVFYLFGFWVGFFVPTLQSTDPVKCRSGSSGINKEGKYAVNIKHASLLIVSMLYTILVQFCPLYRKKQTINEVFFLDQDFNIKNANLKPRFYF